MEPWTYKSYVQPRLAVDVVEYIEHDTAVTLRAAERVYRLEVDDERGAAEIARDLQGLTDASAPLWTMLRDSSIDSGWYALAQFLDSHSLISEGRGDAAIQLEQQGQRIRKHVIATKAAVMGGLSNEERSIVAQHASALRREIPLQGDAESLPFEEGILDSSEEPNFFLALLRLEFAYFRRCSPQTLEAVDLLLQVLSDESECKDAMQHSVHLAGVYDERDLAAHLWLVGRALASSSKRNAGRLHASPIAVMPSATGLEFVRQLELLARDTLNSWGPGPYQAALANLHGEFSPVIAGTFIEQYHVTRRFVEIVTPLLSMRLAPLLRSQLFRYFNEEYGHEALEADTCRTLGIAVADLEKSAPLPFHFAFVDVLTLFASTDPISAFASVILMEGIFGEPPRTSSRLIEEIGSSAELHNIVCKHDELNRLLHHNSMSRKLFEGVGAIAAVRQRVVLRRFQFLLELNRRAWDDVVDFYGSQDHLSLHGPLGRPLVPGCG